MLDGLKKKSCNSLPTESSGCFVSRFLIDERDDRTLLFAGAFAVDFCWDEYFAVFPEVR